MLPLYHGFGIFARMKRNCQHFTGFSSLTDSVIIIKSVCTIIRCGAAYKKGGKPVTRKTGSRRTAKRKKKNAGKWFICIFLELVIILTLVVVIGWDYGVEAWMQELNEPAVRELDISGINSPNAILIQARSGKVLGEINGEERIYPASLTKMMTAVVAMEHLKDLETGITLSQEMFAGLYERDATQAGFQPGETVRAIDLLYGVMLPSGAECCIALAEYISGSEAAFVQLMNEKAKKLKMDQTHFCDSTGLHDPEHYSTVHDMAVLLKYCLKNETFREIIESPWHSTGVTNIHPDGITFYSTMFKNLSDSAVTEGKILGGKTGFTEDAGYCLASFARVGKREYILVTSGAPESPMHIQDAVMVYHRLGEALKRLKT